jgi:hypothetical protein
MPISGKWYWFEVLSHVEAVVVLLYLFGGEVVAMIVEIVFDLRPLSITKPTSPPSLPLQRIHQQQLSQHVPTVLSEAHVQVLPNKVGIGRTFRSFSIKLNEASKAVVLPLLPNY